MIFRWLTSAGTYAEVSPANPLPVDATVTANATAVGTATASAPTYTEGQTDAPFSFDLSGGLRISGSISASTSAHANAAAPSYSEDTDNDLSQTLAGDLRVIAKQNGTWSVGIDQSTPGTTNAVDATNFPAAVAVNSGSKDNNTLRFVIATDQPQLTNALKVDASGATVPISASALPLPSGAATAAKQPALGTAGSASSDVISVQGIASMTPLLSAQSGTWNVGLSAGSNVIGKVSAVDSGGTDATDTTNHAIRVNVVAGGASGGTSSSFGSSFPSTGTAVGASDGTDMQPLLVDGSGNLQVGGTVTANAGTNLNTSALALESGGNLATLASVLGAKTDAKSTATDTTSVSAMQVLKQISASVQAPPSQAVTNAGTFAVQAAQSGTWNVNNVSGTISLPTGAATAAKQPALGTAGSASSDVITIQGIATMTAVKVDGSAVTQPVSGNVGHGKTIKTASVNITADTDIIAAVTSKRIKVIAYALFKTGTNANPIIFKSNGTGGTELARVLLQSQASAVFGANLSIPAPSFLFATAAGEKLTMDVGDSDTITGFITYFDDDAS